MRVTVGSILVIIGFFSLTACNQSPNQSTKTGVVHLDMSQDQLAALRPNLVQDAANPDRYLLPERLFGVDGRWTYYFKDGHLKWYVFNAIQQRVDRDTFDDYLQASNEIIRSYDQSIGQPKRVRQGITEFRDPSLRPHAGYMVQQANWDQGGAKYALDYSFLGEHRTYSLMLSIQVTE